MLHFDVQHSHPTPTPYNLNTTIHQYNSTSSCQRTTHNATYTIFNQRSSITTVLKCITIQIRPSTHLHVRIHATVRSISTYDIQNIAQLSSEQLWVHKLKITHIHHIQLTIKKFLVLHFIARRLPLSYLMVVALSMSLNQSGNHRSTE
jgi:hypothetical protein